MFFIRRDRGETGVFMDISLLEQAHNIIESSRTPVIILPKRPSSDALAAGLGLLLVLERTGRNARIVCPEFSLPDNHSFLPKSQAVERDLASLQNFIISVDLSAAPLESLSYDIEGQELHIHLTPKHGTYRPEHVRAAAGRFAYDLIITLDTPALESLGDMFQNNSAFFYETPVLNIDHRAENKRYGHINVVDVVASSVSEIVFEIIKRLGIEHLDEQVATSLLTGIISKTKAFQARAVTPRSLAIASHLVSSGARRDEIIRHLYQTKNVQTLNLWGRALTRLRASPDGRVIWSSITRADLRESNTAPAQAAGVLDELMVNAPTAAYAVLMIEGVESIDVHVALSPAADQSKLTAHLTTETPEYMRGRLAGPLTRATAEVLGWLDVTATEPPPRAAPTRPSRQPDRPGR